MRLKTKPQSRMEPAPTIGVLALELADLERTARYGKDPATRREAADAIIRQRDDFKGSLDGKGQKSPTLMTREGYDMFKFAVERLAKADDSEIRRRAFEAAGNNVISMKMIDRLDPHGEVGKMARQTLQSMERPNETDPDGLVLFVPSKFALKRRYRR